MEERFELRFSVDQETLDKLNRAKVLIGQGQVNVPFDSLRLAQGIRLASRWLAMSERPWRESNGRCF